jgi:hypothetical protein
VEWAEKAVPFFLKKCMWLPSRNDCTHG